MRTLVVSDLLLALLLFAVASAAGCSADPLAVLAIPICVLGAVGAIAGRVQSYLAAGLIFVMLFVALTLVI
jgi:hypothetical protein